MNTIAKITLFAFQVVFLTVTVSSQQGTAKPGEFRVLDSLLLDGDVPGFLSRWQEVRLSTPSEQYDLLSSRLRELALASEQKVQGICSNIDNSIGRYQAQYAGTNAEVLFERFLTSRAAHNCKEALGFYFAALHFRDRHIQSNKARLRSNLAAAEDLYRAGAFEEVLQAVALFREEDQTTPAFQSLRDSLVSSYDALEKASKTQLSAIRREQEAIPVRKRLAVSFGGGITTFAAQEHRDLVLYSEGFEFPLGQLPTTVKPSYTLQVEYLLSPTLSVTCRTRGGSIYDTELFPWPFGTSRLRLKSDYYSVEIGSTIFFREKTGVRPFFRLTGGIIRIHRHGATMVSSYWGDWGVHLQLDDIRKTYPLLAIGLGSDYEPISHSIFYSVYFSVARHFGGTSLIRNVIGNIEMRIGVNVW